MGFIKQLLGGIFSLIGSIFGGLAKLVGLGKKSEYFLEAEPAGQVAAPAAPLAAATKPSSVNNKAATNGGAIAAPVALAVAETTSSNGNVAATKKKVSKKSAQTETAEGTAPTPVATAAPATPADVTFAPNYLMTANSRSGRRRPGPSMNQFRDMARQVNSQN